MSPRARREYVEAVLPRYKRASRINKGRILDELCSTCGFHCKHGLEHWNLLDTPLLYLSPNFKRNRAEYYRRLNAVRTDGDFEN